MANQIEYGEMTLGDVTFKMQKVLIGKYNTQDATATANNILSGKTAYVADGKVTGAYEPDVLIEKTITANGEYLPSSDNADGYSKVTVAVPIPTSKLSQVLDKSVTELTADDLAGASKIGMFALRDCTALKDVVLPSGVTRLENQSFYGCNHLESVTLPKGVVVIGESVFYNCSALKSITIPNSVTSIGQYSFSGCSGVKAVYITDIAKWCGISFGGYDANPLYYAHNLYLNGELVTGLTIPNGVTSIGRYAFFNCTSLTSVTIGNSVTSIGSYAFEGCTGLTSVTILDSVTSIGVEAFYDCTGLTSVTIGNGVTSIGNSVFSGCTGLTSVTIGNGVASIGNSAFSGCRSLTSITIPDSVTRIGNTAFNGCTGLTSVTIEATTPPTLVNANAFTSTKNYPIYVPAASVEAYKAATKWSSLASRIFAIQE